MAVSKIRRHELASFSQRYTALHIDVAVAFACGTLAWWIAHALGESGAWAMAGFMACMLMRDALPGGQSPGRRVMDIRVVHAVSGRPCALWQSVLRNLCLLVLGVLEAPTALGRQRRTVGDLLARTRVMLAYPAGTGAEDTSPPSAPAPLRRGVRWIASNWFEFAVDALCLALCLSGATAAAVFGKVFLALLLAASAAGLVLRIARKRRDLAEHASSRG